MYAMAKLFVKKQTNKKIKVNEESARERSKRELKMEQYLINGI